MQLGSQINFFRESKYNHDLAQRKCDFRHSHKKKHIKLNTEMWVYITDKLSQKLSPEQIAGISKRFKNVCISHQWIYKKIWEDKKLGGKLCKNLRSRGKPYLRHW
jgi:IS30 family transposase